MIFWTGIQRIFIRRYRLTVTRNKGNYRRNTRTGGQEVGQILHEWIKVLYFSYQRYILVLMTNERGSNG